MPAVKTKLTGVRFDFDAESDRRFRVIIEAGRPTYSGQIQTFYERKTVVQVVEINKDETFDHGSKFDTGEGVIFWTEIAYKSTDGWTPEISIRSLYVAWFIMTYVTSPVLYRNTGKIPTDGDGMPSVKFGVKPEFSSTDVQRLARIVATVATTGRAPNMFFDGVEDESEV